MDIEQKITCLDLATRAFGMRGKSSDRTIEDYYNSFKDLLEERTSSDETPSMSDKKAD